MRNLLLAALISIFSAQVAAQTETHSGDFILNLPGKHSLFLQGFRTFFAGEYVAPEKNLAVLRQLNSTTLARACLATFVNAS